MLTLAAAAMLLQPARLEGARADAACVVGRLTEAQREGIVTPFLVGSQPDDALGVVLIDAVEACGQATAWSERRAEDAAYLAAMQMVSAAVHPRLVAAGIDPRRVETWFAGQSKAVRTNTAMPDSDIRRLILSLQASGIEMAVLERQGILIGQYLATLIAAARIREGMRAG